MPRFTIDPRWATFMVIAIALGNFLAGATAQWTDLGLTADQIKHGVAAWNLGGGALGIIAGFLAGVPSKDSQTGFIIKAPPKPPGAA